MKRSIIALAMLAGMLWTVPLGVAADKADQPVQACDEPTDTISLFAKKLGPGRIGYGLTPDSVSVPGPTIEMNEGECLHINLVNQTDKRLSFHPHGVDYTVASDGTPLNKSCVKAGRQRTYVIAAHAPSLRSDGSVEAGNAGYWHYHDHCMGTDHGTGGVRKGLYGALVVRRAGDPLPDKQFVMVMNNISFNNTVAPNTPMPEANMGERVEFIVIAHGELFHTFHLHGHRWADNRTGTLETIDEGVALIDNRTAGPADSFGFQVIAGEGVGPGAWMYHCHVQGHSDAGMAGIFLVKTTDGVTTRRAQEAILEFDASHGSDSHH